jgi:hypothetical protein
MIYAQKIIVATFDLPDKIIPMMSEFHLLSAVKTRFRRSSCCMLTIRLLSKTVPMGKLAKWNISNTDYRINHIIQNTCIKEF